jgi:integrase
MLGRLLEEGKGYTANRVYEALHTLFKWLYQRDRVPVNIMDKIEKPFDGEKPKERTWSDSELKQIWKAADQLDPQEAAYLRLLLLLGQRRNEIAGMRWDEFDLEAATWSLSADRAKGKRVHTFPLPTEAVQLLEALPRVYGNPFVFPGRGTTDGEPCPMTIGSKLQHRVQQASGVDDFTFHDARRSFRTGLDRLHILPHITDECLNHARRGVGDRHYSQYHYLDEQRSAFDAWANFIMSLVKDKPIVNAVKMRAAR